MKPLKCMLSRPFLGQDLDYLTAGLSGDVELVVPEDFSPEALSQIVKDGVEVIIGAIPDRSVLQAARGLKFIQVPWTGVDNLDFELCREFDLTICNSHSNSQAVAEMAVSLLLASAKMTPYHDAELREGRWHRPGGQQSFLPPVLLQGKTLGLCGYGAVNQKVRQLLSGFEMAVQVMDLHPPQDPNIIPFSPDQFEAFLTDCDFVVIAIPLTDQTQGLFDTKAFEAMKPSAILVNVARGRVVEEKAFFEVLQEQKIAGAGVDVWYQYPARGRSECPPSEYDFASLDNVVLSPHRAGFIQGQLPHLDGAIENINGFAAGEPLRHVVDLNAQF